MPHPGRSRQRPDHARGRPVLDQRRDEIFVIPDILCNAGGVIVSYFEWVQGLQQFFWNESEIMERLQQALERSFQQVMKRAEKDRLSHRNAALAIGVETVRRAKQTRGLFRERVRGEYSCRSLTRYRRQPGTSSFCASGKRRGSEGLSPGRSSRR